MTLVKYLALGTIALAGLQAVPASGLQHEGHKKQSKAAPKHQMILVSNGKYSPATVKVKAGKPVHLMFKLGPNPGCGNVLVIEKLKIKRNLAAGKTTAVTFTPKKPGRYPFTCGMGMFKGTIIVT